MKKDLLIIKVGGNILDDEMNLKKFIGILTGISSPFILVHGGGKLATALSSQLGIETKMVNGRRITDKATLDVTVMVYAGLINKSIAASLNAKGKKAIGLCGADDFCIPASRRKKEVVDYGHVGDIDTKKIKTDLFSSLIKQNITPVIAPITADKNGHLLNTNADTIASGLAIAMSDKYSTKLIFCMEKKGVLNGKKTLRTISRNDQHRLIQKGIIKEGMIPKLDNAFDAVGKGVRNVIIGHALDLKKIIHGNAGTHIG